MSITFDEEPRYEVPNDLVVLDATADGHVFWFERMPEQRCRVAWDGAPGDPFTLIPQRSGRPFEWSPDRRHVTYYGVRGDRPFVGVDAREEGPYDDVTRSVPPTYTADGGRLAYGAMIRGSARLILDGDPVAGSELAPCSVTWSPDGRRLAYAEQEYQVSPRDARKAATIPRQRVVVDGRPGPWVEALGDLPGVCTFSPDGQHFAYVASGRQHRVVIDGEPQQVVDAVGELCWSPDSSRLAYVAMVGGRCTVVDGARSGRPYWRIADLTFSPDARRLAYVGAVAKGRFVVVVDDVAGPEFTDLWEGLTFSPDGRRLAYLAQRRGPGMLGRFRHEYVAVVDGDPGAPFDEVSSSPHMSPDGRHLAFSARRGAAWSVVLDGVSGEPFDRVGPPRYGSRGVLRFLAERGKQMTVVTEGRPGPWANQVDNLDGTLMTVSDDDRHTAWVAMLADGAHPVVDDTVGDRYAGVGRGLFSDDPGVRFPCVRDNQLVVVHARW